MLKEREEADEERDGETPWRYRIGELVVGRGAYEKWRLAMAMEVLYGRDGLPACEVVIERLTQECHGGVQRLYRLRRYAPDGHEVLHNLTAAELVPWGEVETIVAGWLAGRDAKKGDGR